MDTGTASDASTTKLAMELKPAAVELLLIGRCLVRL